MTAAEIVGALVAGLPDRVVRLEWRGRGAILTLELSGGEDAEGWRVQVDPISSGGGDCVCSDDWLRSAEGR